ncbi:gephyrin-like molybdotransferase Glp [Blastochloris tepida]|uniref:Molybdopterin molybdenumtransferase n=1 Tax=Blastochloris tepida TaxID=2233851 RepID=A0A348G247_9HYPH|nr:gephyrin-like molybdotransferase Glp [Blastochloris tepida]BBF93630.1 molybdopterin molybdenumtransferase MoeA [Blastochloris tepida]
MTLIALDDAQRRVLDGAQPLPAEDVPLAAAHGRVLAADVRARRTQPDRDVSAMDGYAVRHADLAAPPSRLRLAGVSAAGRPFAGRLAPGQAVRIFTGAVVPEGADTVVMQEDCTAEGDAVLIAAVPHPGRHIRQRGLDFSEGRVLLPAGRRLSARDIGLAAAMNHPTLPVHRRPRVALVSTGDELVPPGVIPAEGQIVASNGPYLAAALEGEGAEVVDLGLVPDRLEATVAAVQAAHGMAADVLVTTGGASVGEHDMVHRALEADGIDLGFWRIALRPGRPLIFGRRDGMRVLGLPGNPVSAFTCALLFLLPLVRALGGRADILPQTEPARLGVSLPAGDQRAELLRGTLAHQPDGTLTATPFAEQDSSLLSLLAAADCCILREPFAPAAAAGEPCRIIRLGL